MVIGEESEGDPMARGMEPVDLAPSRAPSRHRDLSGRVTVSSMISRTT